MMAKGGVALPAGVLGLLAAIIVIGAPLSAQSASFVQRRGTQLTLDGEPWYFLGANAYWLMDFAKQGKTSTVDSFFRACGDHGLKVVRLWGFNHNSPSARGVYDESEMKSFDYIIDSAGKHGIRLILALGNTWSAYRSPEDFMRMAGDDPSGKDLLDFYQSERTKVFFKGHMYHMVNRLNTYNQVVYKDDPTIMMWDVFNEPRCPGCTEAWQQQAVQGWLQDMASTLKRYAPNQVIAAGTEGYFMDDANVRWNPGAGAYCEGEDWMAINRLPALDCGAAHIYDRQMESVPPKWTLPTFEDLIQWTQRYLDAHVTAAKSVGKPLIVEEFNVIFPKFSDDERTVFFQLINDFLMSQQKSGGPLMGVMFWNGAIGGDVWDDGYNVYLDVSAPPPPPPPTSGPAAPQPSGGSPAAAPIRKAIYANKEGLDGFRRGPQRASCAEQAGKWWTPLWTDPSQRTVDVAGLQTRTKGKTVQQVIKQTAQNIY